MSDDLPPPPSAAPPPDGPSDGYGDVLDVSSLDVQLRSGGNGNGNGRARSAYDRVPPHSLEAEVSVLGAALLSPSAANEIVNHLKPEDFYRSAHGAVYEAVMALVNTGVDSVTVLEWLNRHGRLEEIGGPAAIHELTAAVPTAANAVHYAQIVKEKALLRRLIDVGTDVTRLGYEATEDAATVVDQAESMIYEIAEHGTKSDYSKLSELLNESFEMIEKLAENRSEVTGLPTGFNDLDRLTAGLQPQNLVIVAARPAMGKSSLSLNLAQYVTVELRRPAIIFSLEMSKIEIVNRMLSSEARIDSSKIKTGRLEDADWRKLGDALGRLSEAPLFIDDTPSITLMEIRAKSRRLKQKHGLDLIIVDYLQLMQSHRRVDSRQQEVAEISRGLKMLAKELDVPVIALSQLSRQPESRTDKRPQLADLRESGCLTRGTRLFRADTGAPVTFGELLDGDLRDVPVWASDHAGRLVAGRLTHAFPSGRKAVHRVTLASGMVVEATANHPFRTLDGWRPLGDLAPGDRVGVARRLPEPSAPVPMDTDELVLLAHLIGEGTIVAGQPVHYTSADDANLDAVEKAAWHRFGITARRAADGRSSRTTQLYLPSPHHLTHGRRNPIAAWLDGLGLWDRRAWEKRLPAAVFALPDEQVRAFLHHLWATDGCIWVRPESGRGPLVRTYYATSSPELARDVQLLLLRLDIRARVRAVPQPGARDQHHVVVSGASEQRRLLELVGAHGARGDVVPEALRRLGGSDGSPNVDTVPIEVWDTVRRRCRERGISQRELARLRGRAYGGASLFATAPSRARLGEIADVLADAELSALATTDLLWDRIVSVEPLGEQDVFDATVEEHHCFVAEGLLLHNSIEQDADIVGFIYRDEVYDEDSPEKGIAELIIAKHRNGPTGTVKLAFLNHLTKFANLARAPGGGGGGGGGGNGYGGGSPMPPAPPPPGATTPV
ncbi:MAG: replicative DNA helicase [Actinomycetes bacterium]